MFKVNVKQGIIICLLKWVIATMPFFIFHFSSFSFVFVLLASTSAHLRYHYQKFIIRFGQWETFFNNGQKLKLLCSIRQDIKQDTGLNLFTINICLLDLKTISLALLHSLLSSTWNGTNSERICSIMEMTLNYAYVIKTVIFVPTPHHSRINSEPLTPCKNIPKPQKGRQRVRCSTLV